MTAPSLVQRLTIVVGAEVERETLVDVRFPDGGQARRIPSGRVNTLLAARLVEEITSPIGLSRYVSSSRSSPVHLTEFPWKQCLSYGAAVVRAGSPR